MNFKILLSPKSNDFLEKLDKIDNERIKKKLKSLSKYPELGKPLAGKLKGLWSLRIGIFRVIYQIRQNELLILVLKIGQRKNVYD